MEPYPLNLLAFYEVKKDFTSDQGYKNADQFKKGQKIQLQEKISDIHGMMEILHFRDTETNQVLIWRTRVENLYDSWKEYLTRVKI